MPVALLAVARVAVGVRFRQSPLAVLLTPLAMALMLVLQWSALVRRRTGAALWRGRMQST